MGENGEFISMLLCFIFLVSVITVSLIYNGCDERITTKCSQYDVYRSSVTSYYQTQNTCTRCSVKITKCNSDGDCKTSCEYYTNYICYDTYYQETYNGNLVCNFLADSNNEYSSSGYSIAKTNYPMGQKDKIYVNKYNHQCYNQSDIIAIEDTGIFFLIIDIILIVSVICISLKNCIDNFKYSNIQYTTINHQETNPTHKKEYPQYQNSYQHNYN